MGLLMAVAAAIRDHEEIRFAYRDDERFQVEPYRLVSWQRRWYLVARDGRTDGWSSFRLDWMQLRVPAGADSPQSNCPAVIIQRSCCVRRHSPAGRYTSGSLCTRRPRTC